MSVGAVRGVLVLHGDRWVVANDSEVRLLEALRGERGALDRLRALAAVLDAGLVGAGGLRRLNTQVSQVAACEKPEDVCRVRVPNYLLGPLAYVCVCSDDDGLSRWLGWALSARLDANLVRGLLPGPGWESLHMPLRRRWGTYDRDTHWISEMPESFWDRLHAHRDERLRAVAAGSDPTARRRVLADLADKHRTVPEVLDVVACNPQTPTRVLRWLARYAGATRAGLRVAQNRSATAGLLGELARSPDWEMRYVAAWHPKVPVSALRRLAGDESMQVRAAVARAVAVPVPVLEVLATDADVWVRRNAAWNPSCPQGVLEVLLGDRLGAVRAAAVDNENTPLELVEARASDRVIGVRWQVASRRGVRPEVLAVLAEDPKDTVRQAVTHNAQTPPAALGLLAQDRCSRVRNGVARHPSTPSDTLRALAGDERWGIRTSVAANQSAPVEVLVMLAGDAQPTVRSGAPRTPRCRRGGSSGWPQTRTGGCVRRRRRTRRHRRISWRCWRRTATCACGAACATTTRRPSVCWTRSDPIPTTGCAPQPRTPASTAAHTPRTTRRESGDETPPAVRPRQR